MFMCVFFSMILWTSPSLHCVHSLSVIWNLKLFCCKWDKGHFNLKEHPYWIQLICIFHAKMKVKHEKRLEFQAYLKWETSSPTFIRDLNKLDVNGKIFEIFLFLKWKTVQIAVNTLPQKFRRFFPELYWKVKYFETQIKDFALCILMFE